MALITAAEFEARQQQRLAELAAARAVGRKVVGYWCSYVPVELISASGAIAVRLYGASAKAEECGERFLRADACSFCKACLGGFETDDLYRLVDGVVNVSTCDMMRRLGEAVTEFARVPAFTLYLPRTSEPLVPRVAEFSRQLELLAGWLAELTGTKMDGDRLSAAIARYNRLRQLLRELDIHRAQPAPVVSASDILNLTALSTILEPEQAAVLLEQAVASRPAVVFASVRRPRLMLAGSILTPADRWFVELLEEGADIVADLLCTGARWSAESPHSIEPSVSALARYYYGRPACACRRPNDGLYQMARRLVDERGVQGLVLKTLLYCDPWSFEGRRLRRELGIPVLAVDSDYSGQNREQVRTRIEAFLETL